MSRVCYSCGKGKMTGNTVSHSNIKTKRTMGANLHKVEIEDENGATKKEYLCTKCMKGSKKDK